MPSSSLSWPSLGLLALGVVSAFVGWNVNRPLRRTVWTGTVFFFVGWLTGELALHQVMLQLAMALALILLGGLGHVLGLVGMALAVIGWASLLRFHERGHRARDRARHTFAEHANHHDLVHLPQRVGLREVALPFSMRKREVTRTQRLLVHRGEDYTLHADVYHHASRPSRAPVLVYVHGGGWTIGFKHYQGLPILYRLASQGWVCISIDYRLSPRATFPDHVIDVMRGIAWARAHAHEFGGDPAFVAICGNSAGAHLAALAALTSDYAVFKPGFENVGTHVDACVGLYGVYDFTDRHGHWPGLGVRPFLERVVVKQRLDEAPDAFRLASPIDHVRTDAPPFFLIHGDRDSLVPVDESRRFVDALRAASSSPVMYAEIEDAQHAFEIFHSVRGRYTVEAIVDFLEMARRRKAALTTSEPAAEIASLPA